MSGLVCGQLDTLKPKTFFVIQVQKTTTGCIQTDLGWQCCCNHTWSPVDFYDVLSADADHHVTSFYCCTLLVVKVFSKYPSEGNHWRGKFRSSHVSLQILKRGLWCVWTLTQYKLTMMQSNSGRLPLLSEEFHSNRISVAAVQTTNCLTL